MNILISDYSGIRFQLYLNVGSPLYLRRNFETVCKLRHAIGVGWYVLHHGIYFLRRGCGNLKNCVKKFMNGAFTNLYYKISIFNSSLSITVKYINFYSCQQSCSNHMGCLKLIFGQLLKLIIKAKLEFELIIGKCA